MSRCGLEPEQYFEHEDFMAIFDFNTPATIAALGTAVSQINQQVLRQIGAVIRNAEREKLAERRSWNEQHLNLQAERGLSDPQPGTERAAGEAPLGKYGRMRKTYLKEHRPVLYSQLLLSEKLYPHLLETDETANRRLDQLMQALTLEAGATESLKASDPMKWVGLMNSCKAQAEELILAELINS